VSGARLALIVVTAAALVRLALGALIPAFPDETYYWEWSRRLAAGYFDHPPAIAWLIRAGDALFALGGRPATAFSIRLGPIVASWIAAVATVGIARRIGGDVAAFRAALIITVMPLAAAGLLVATPDSPLLAAVALTLYCLVRALEHAPRSRASLGWWTLTGAMLGLAFSSKYTSIFLPIGVLVAVVAHPQLRSRLAEPGPYVACLVATLVFAPVLAWNASHGWISFAYQVRHGLAAPQGSALVAAWKHEGDFFGGQAALASPILFVMLAIAVARAWSRERRAEPFMLAIVALVSFGFFVYSAVRQRVEPNWPAPAYIPAIALLAATEWTSTGAKWLSAGVLLAAAMSAVIYVQGLTPILPIAATKDPIARAFGWDELARRSAALASTTTSTTGHATWSGGDRYQEASALAFHLPGQPRTFATNLSGRPNQYDLWPHFSDVARAGDNLLLAVDDGAEPHASVTALAPYFADARKADRVTLRRGDGVVATRRLWVLVSWSGRRLPIAAAP
jgi:4-amino-4-deoxy-L-arabinose transferase-like glycosyltransferase